MKKITAKMIAVALAATTLSMAGCSLGKTVQSKGDDTKTQLRISVYEAGFGTEWMETYAKEFEEKYAQHSFEEGKKGVQVRLDKNQINDEVMLGQVERSENALYFNNVDYYALATSGVAEDLTPYMRAEMTEFKDTGTIEDKLQTEQKEYMLNYDEKYYAVPSYEMYRGVTYNIDLFEEKALYLAEDGTFTSGLSGQPAKSKGPDNQTGTYDDGLPATYDEFFAMMDNMVENSVTPFVWTGAYRYANMLTDGLVNNFEGNDLNLHYTFDGTAHNLVSVDGNGTITSLGDTAITWQNGYDLRKSEAYYRALEFAKKLVSNSAYYATGSFTDLTHTGAQEKYLMSRLAKNGEQPIAMIVEGSYWQCEAMATFNSMNGENGEKYGFDKSRFGFMPMPHYDEARAEKNGYKQTLASEMFYAFMKKGLDEGTKAAAVKFLQFTSSNDMLRRFLRDTHYARALTVNVPEDEYSQMNAYAKSIYDVKSNYNLVYKFSTKPFWLKYESALLAEEGCPSTVGEKAYKNPIYDFHGDSNLTVVDYFNGLHKWKEDSWANYSL